jgi:type I pantothenate kinase
MSQPEAPLTGASEHRKGAQAVLEAILYKRRPGRTWIAGLTGSVAAGKSTLCATLRDVLSSSLCVETVSTDGFLFPNDHLAPRGLLMRKGYPETYDHAALKKALREVRSGPVRLPTYSHLTYDVAIDRTIQIDQPDILILEGLGLNLVLSRESSEEALDTLIYLDASEEDLETWYVERFLRLWNEAQSDPASFYVRFLHMTQAEVDQFARQVWRDVNLPNLRENIVPLRDHADIVIRKDGAHQLTLLRA